MKRRALFTTLLAGACVSCLWPRGLSAADWLGSPALPDVTLLDQHGQPWRLADVFAERLVAVGFMFTACTTLCPPQTALMRETYRRLRGEPGMEGLRIVSITVDPYGDGPEQLRAYAERFELPRPDWVLLTGEADDIGQVLRAFEVRSTNLSEHPPLLWFGDTRRGRWTRTSSLNPPQAMVDLLRELAT